jgi:predicted permease
VPVGFERENVLTTRLSVPRSRYDSKEKIAAFYDELLMTLRALPGVQYAGGTYALPFSGDFASSTFVPAGSTIPPAQAPSITTLSVRGDYFNALGMRLLRGRMFAEGDRAGSMPVVLVNRALAQRFWPGEDAVGKQIVEPEAPQSPYTVVGVVNDVRRRDLSDEVQPEIYLPHAQAIWDGSLYIALRFSGSAETLAAQLRREVWRIDPQLPVRAPIMLEEMIGNSIAAPRFRAYVFLTLAGSAAALALIGVYGLLAFMVTLRRRDIAIRLALGATPRIVLTEVTRSGIKLMVIGLSVGLAVALLLTGQLRTFLFQLEPNDPLTFGGTALVVLFAGVLAALLPAARAARIEPLRSISS